MATNTQHSNDRRGYRPLFCGFILAATVTVGIVLAPSATLAQTAPVSPITLASQNARGLADVLTRVQHLFLAPITFEEVPYENAAELKSIVVVQNGIPQTRLVNPVIPFSVTLGSGDLSPELVAQSVLSAYKQAGGPGTYTVVSLKNRVDVMPTQVLGSDGSLKSINTPIMSQPVTFPVATRSLSDTLQLLLNDVSRESGFKMVLLDIPGSQTEAVALGAAGVPARDVIANMGAALNRTVSFQSLYDVASKTYYLNVMAVAADPVAGGPPHHGYINPQPTVGPANSPFFIKK